MTRIQNSIRKDGTYYFRRIIRLGEDKPFRIRMSLRTTNHRRARIMTPALVVKSEALRMSMLQTISRDGLTAEQRAEIFRRQMLRERDRLEAGHAQLQLADLDDQLPEEALEVRLDMSEAVSGDLARNGETGPLLVIRIPPEDPQTGEEPPIEILTWEDYIGALAGELWHGRDVGQAAKVGLGTWLGIVLGVVLKLGLTFAMLGLFVFAWIF